jgi:hypothetical protein
MVNSGLKIKVASELGLLLETKSTSIPFFFATKFSLKLEYSNAPPNLWTQNVMADLRTESIRELTHLTVDRI